MKTLDRIFTKYDYVLDEPKHKNAKETIERVLSNNLQTIFTENMAILDKPENAKKIMPLLLADRLKTIKKDKVSLMNNLIHLAQKAKLQESFKPQQTKEIN